jgi:hypothetical protein
MVRSMLVLRHFLQGLSKAYKNEREMQKRIFHAEYSYVMPCKFVYMPSTVCFHLLP